ncbi:MAG: glycosidase [Paraglaciecola sp.]|jgi:glycosidase
MKFIPIVIFLTFLSLSTNLFSQNKIDRIEPPSWWAGMVNPELQLLVYGENIGGLKPKIDYAGVTVQQVIRVENQNYLFLDLLIEDDVKPGKISINFYNNEQLTETHFYELKQRKADGAAMKGFDSSDVLYLITPDRFANGDPKNDAVEGLLQKPNRTDLGGRHGGDIAGMNDHLDYLSDMGFTAVWVNPLLENDMEIYSYHGYSTTDFYKVDSRFGSNEAYQQLAENCRQKDVKFIMDMIVNHCGLNHWWMKDLPMDDWINQWDTYTETNHRKTLLQDPYASKYDKKKFTDGWFVPTMPDLNQRNPLMGKYLIQNSIWWIEFLGLAGIRMDTYPYPDMDYMTEWTEKVMAEYPNFTVVGEEWFEWPAIVSYWQKGKNNPNGYTSELTSVMDFPVQVAAKNALLEPESWKTGFIGLYEMLAQDFLYPDPNNLVIFPDNHDMSRFFTQLKEDYDLFKMGMTFYATTRGIPQFYYGTEILMTNPNSEDHGEIRSDFPGGWAGDKVDAKTGKGLTEQQKSAQDFTKKLLNWRKNKAVIHTGELRHFIPELQTYVYFRYNDTEKVMVILNKNEADHVLNLARFAEILEGISTGTDVMTGQQFEMEKEILLPNKAALILELR